MEANSNFDLWNKTEEKNNNSPLVRSLRREQCNLQSEAYRRRQEEDFFKSAAVWLVVFRHFPPEKHKHKMRIKRKLSVEWLSFREFFQCPSRLFHSLSLFLSRTHESTRHGGGKSCCNSLDETLNGQVKHWRQLSLHTRIWASDCLPFL